MFVIYANGEVVHDASLHDERRLVSRPVLTQTLNSSGQLTFSMAPNHALFDDISVRTSYVVVEDDGVEIWRGRLISTSRGVIKSCTCEGELSYLSDSIQLPFRQVSSVSDALNAILYRHNQQVDTARQFSLGTVTVTAPNDGVLTIEQESPDTTWSIIQQCFIDELGGYIVSRRVEDTTYIDYFADFDANAQQNIEFGKNMLDLTESIDAGDIVTVLVPYGATLEEGDSEYETKPTTNTFWDGNRRTIKSVNDGDRQLESAAGVALWGKIWGSNIWDDVETAQDLKSTAESWLTDKIAANLSLTVRAFDLSILGEDISPIEVGTYVNAVSILHGIDVRLLCREKVTYLTEPDKTKITLGAGAATITDLEGRYVADVYNT